MGFTNFPNGLTSFGIPQYGNSGPIGIGTGNIYYLVTTKASTDLYYQRLKEHGIPGSDIFTSIITAHAAMTADQNDVLVVMPGLHTQTATCDWTKDHCHIVGLAGPNLHQRYGRPNCMVFTDTATVDYTIHLTGDFCQFSGFMIGNGHSAGAATAENLSAIGVAGYGNSFHTMGFQGVGSATQAASNNCSSVEIMAGAGELNFENCLIGGNTYLTTRSGTASGHLRFTSTEAGLANGLFRNCLFLSRSAVDAVPMVFLYSQAGLDRAWQFDRCHFDNYTPSWTGLPLENVFGLTTQSPQTVNVTLKDCTANGYQYWSNTNVGAGGALYLKGNMPAVAVLGGVCVDITGTS